MGLKISRQDAKAQRFRERSLISVYKIKSLLATVLFLLQQSLRPEKLISNPDLCVLA
jgi:hypothetical protein